MKTVYILGATATFADLAYEIEQIKQSEHNTKEQEELLDELGIASSPSFEAKPVFLLSLNYLKHINRCIPKHPTHVNKCNKPNKKVTRKNNWIYHQKH